MADRKGGSIPGTPQAKHGGQATKAKYGTEHYSEIGKKGGTVTTERHGREHYVRMGTKGGNARQQRRRDSPITQIPAPEPPAGAF